MYAIIIKDIIWRKWKGTEISNICNVKIIVNRDKVCHRKKAKILFDIDYMDVDPMHKV